MQLKLMPSLCMVVNNVLACFHLFPQNPADEDIHRLKMVMAPSERRFGFSVIGGADEGFGPRVDDITLGRWIFHFHWNEKCWIYSSTLSRLHLSVVRIDFLRGRKNFWSYWVVKPLMPCTLVPSGIIQVHYAVPSTHCSVSVNMVSIRGDNPITLLISHRNTIAVGMFLLKIKFGPVEENTYVTMCSVNHTCF